MSWLLDTNVLSEVRKSRCHPSVRAWFDSVDSDELFVSVLVTAEIRRGVELVRRRDARQAAILERWLSQITRDHADRILPVDGKVADRWGRLSATRPLSTVDGLLAATALAYDLTLVTRNGRHVAGTGVRVLDPWA